MAKFRSVTRLMVGGAMAAALMVSSMACKSSGASNSGGVSVPLVYHPTNIVEGSLSVPTGKPKIFIAPVEDTRTQPKAIGENREESTPIPVTIGSGSASQFVHDALRDEMRKHGIDVVDDAAGADRTLSASITTFEANEAPNYHGTILLSVKVLDASGKVLTERTVSGENSTWGKSADPANYQQVLSNAMVDLIGSMMKNADFMQALSVTAKSTV